MRAIVTFALNTGSNGVTQRAEKRLWEGGFRPKGRKTWEAAAQSEDRIFAALRGFLELVEGPEATGRVKHLWVYVSESETTA